MTQARDPRTQEVKSRRNEIDWDVLYPWTTASSCAPTYSGRPAKGAIRAADVTGRTQKARFFRRAIRRLANYGARASGCAAGSTNLYQLGRG